MDLQVVRESDLGSLGDPGSLHSPLELLDTSREELLGFLRMMLTIRFAEEAIGDGVADGSVVGPAHLGIGQEAVAAGVARHLRPSDRAFGAHRSHSHYLGLGGDLYPLMAEVLGRYDGCARGMGGSMHLWNGRSGLMGTVPIVSGTIPLAVGAGLAARKDKRGDIAIAFFGDGACEEGAFHESLNLAAAWKLPVLFVCENNLYSSHMHVDLRQPSDRMARFAEANCIPSMTIDGNDVVGVSKATEILVAHGRRGVGPAFLEAVTYRWRGHVGHREDEDVGVERGAALGRWKQRDPVRRLVEAMLASEKLSEGELSQIATSVREEVAEAWRQALEAPFPEDSALLRCVYAGYGR